MSRLGDVLYFLRQIFFPNWIDREDEDEPTGLQKILAAIFLFLSSRNGTGTVFSIILHAFILTVLSLNMTSQLGSFAGIDILGGHFIPGAEPSSLNLGPASEPGLANSDSSQEDAPPGPKQDVASETGGAEDTSVQPPGFGDDAVSDPGGLASTESWQINGVGGFVPGGGLQNRNPHGRRGALGGGGGGGGGNGQGGEDAVEAALTWFAAHQQPDGGWSLDFNDSCQRCSHSGTGRENRRTAATALALLSFLGAGYSHQTESQYQKVVERGLLFLIRDPNGGINGAAIRRDDLRMYSYGLAAIALCEAYAMSREQDPKSQLGDAAQKSLWLIETAQDPEYGGWNYRPDQRTRKGGSVGGDTSIFAWQLMALKSGKIGGLNVSQSVIYAAQDFLDSVALEGGRRYQYLPDGKWDSVRSDDSPKTCTAIGLLSRMYLGWKPGYPALDDGMDQIVRWGYIIRKEEVNLYYIYYATLALHHYGGEHWDTWNNGIRALLIRTQSRQGCESGSWHFSDPYCNSGGRLLNTALAVMILETPYRFMPLYRKIR